MIRKKRFFLIFSYIVFLIVLIEGSSRLVYLIPQVSKMLWVADDLGWRRLWVGRRQNAGEENLYSFDVYDPSKGWIAKPNIRDMKVFDGKVLNTNSKGFRGRGEYPYRKNQDKVRILVLGDSFTFGEEVSDNETYSYYLQEMIPHSEVINMGMHGYGHDQMLILLGEEGIQYQPDIIILGFLTMDMSRNLRNFRDYAKPKFVIDNNEIRLTGTPVPLPDEVVKWDWARPRIVDILSSLRYRIKKLSGVLEQEKSDITSAILTKIIQLADSMDAIPVFAYLPTINEFSIQAPRTRGEDYLFAFCQKNEKVRCLSTRPLFTEKMSKGFTFKKHGHWGSEGHRVAAESIKSYLVGEGYVDLHASID